MVVTGLNYPVPPPFFRGVHWVRRQKLPIGCKIMKKIGKSSRFFLTLHPRGNQKAGYMTVVTAPLLYK